MSSDEGIRFNDWIVSKYLEWRSDNYGPGSSITAYAEYIGVSHQLMSRWMIDDTPRSQKSISRLVDKYGLEVYKVLGIPITQAERELWEFRDLLKVLTPAERAELKKHGYMLLDKHRQEEMRDRLKR